MVVFVGEYQHLCGRLTWTFNFQISCFELLRKVCFNSGGLRLRRPALCNSEVMLHSAPLTTLARALLGFCVCTLVTHDLPPPPTQEKPSLRDACHL